MKYVAITSNIYVKYVVIFLLCFHIIIYSLVIVDNGYNDIQIKVYVDCFQAPQLFNLLHNIWYATKMKIVFSFLIFVFFTLLCLLLGLGLEVICLIKGTTTQHEGFWIFDGQFWGLYESRSVPLLWIVKSIKLRNSRNFTNWIPSIWQANTHGNRIEIPIS